MRENVCMYILWAEDGRKAVGMGGLRRFVAVEGVGFWGQCAYGKFLVITWNARNGIFRDF